MLFVFSTCRELIRTLPMMLHDPIHPEDLDTTMEDHAVDEFRYALMTRPFLAVDHGAELEDRNPYWISNCSSCRA